MKSDEIPGCTCGSKEAGLIWISEENRYQCGTCIQKVYAKLAVVRSRISVLKKELEAHKKYRALNVP